MKKARKQQTLRKGLSQHSESVDMDPFSTSVLDQLIQTQSQWSNVQQIVKLTFKAVADLVHLHGGSMKDIKNLLTTRASKTQLTTGLSLKSNVSDLTRVMTQLTNGLDSKVSQEDLHNAILGRDYVKRSQVSELLMMNKREKQKSQQHSESILSIKNSRQKTDQQLELTVLQARMDDFQKELCKKIANCVSYTEFQQLTISVQQKVNASEINEALQNKVSKHYLQTCLQKKMNKSEIDEYINSKADSTDLEYILSSLENKASVSTIQRLTQVLENKADKSDLTLLTTQRMDRLYGDQRGFREKQRERQERQRVVFDNLNREIKHEMDKVKLSVQSQQSILRNELLSQMKNIDNSCSLKLREVQSDIQEIRVECQKLKAHYETTLISSSSSKSKGLEHEIAVRSKMEEEIFKEIDLVRKVIEQCVKNGVKRREFSQLKNEVDSIVQERVSHEDLQLAFNKLQSTFNEKMGYEKEEHMGLLSKIQKTLTESVSLNSSDIANLSEIISRKQERFDSTLMEQMAKKNRKEVQDCRRTVDTTYAEMQSKLNITEYESDLIEIKKRFDSLVRDLNMKASIKDVCILADSKPNIDDVNKALKELNQGIETRISENELSSILKDQAAINETLCSENIVGRWLWQSGQLKPGGLVPWEVQCANTVPQHFFWEKDKTSILVYSSGIYEITACLFTKNGYASVFVNNQLITPKQEENGILKKGNKKKKEKEISASKIQQFIKLPTKSRITISSPVEGIEGFLNIRRL